jgi:hypothetical protein
MGAVVSYFEVPTRNLLGGTEEFLETAVVAAESEPPTSNKPESLPLDPIYRTCDKPSIKKSVCSILTTTKTLRNKKGN